MGKSFCAPTFTAVYKHLLLAVKKLNQYYIYVNLPKGIFIYLFEIKVLVFLAIMAKLNLELGESFGWLL